MLNKDKIIILYEYIYGEFSGNKDFILKMTSRNNKIIENFVSSLPSNYGDNWLFNFFCFQFSKYYDKKTRFGVGKIMLNWILSVKAVKYFNDAPDEEKYWGEVFKSKFKLVNPLLKRGVFDKSYLDLERKRFYNTDLGLLHCIDLGLYDKMNKNCIFCKNRKICNGAKKII